MESPALASNLFKYLFLAALYLFILGIFWTLWRQTRELGGPAAQSSRTSHSLLTLVVESGSGKRFPAGQELTIGRSPDNTIVLSDRFVSSRHATVRRQGSEVWLVDEGSTNGTFLNGFRISAPSALKAGDTFVVGGTVFRLVPE